MTSQEESFPTIEHKSPPLHPGVQFILGAGVAVGASLVAVLLGLLGVEASLSFWIAILLSIWIAGFVALRKGYPALLVGAIAGIGGAWMVSLLVFQ